MGADDIGSRVGSAGAMRGFSVEGRAELKRRTSILSFSPPVPEAGQASRRRGDRSRRSTPVIRQPVDLRIVGPVRDDPDAVAQPRVVGLVLQPEVQGLAE